MSVDFYALLRARVPTLTDFSASSRGGLYRKVVGAAQTFLARDDIALSAQDRADVRWRIDLAIRRIEGEFELARRRGLAAPDWALPDPDRPPTRDDTDLVDEADDTARLPLSLEDRLCIYAIDRRLIDFEALLHADVPGLPDLSASSRGGLYRRLAAATEAVLTRFTATYTPAQKADVRRQLDDAIRRIEADFARARENGTHVPEWARPPQDETPVWPESVTNGFADELEGLEARLAQFITLDGGIDFESLLRFEIPSLGDLSASSRGTLYRNLVAATEALLARAGPRATSAWKADLRRRLDAAIASVERDFAEARARDSSPPEWAAPRRTAAPAAGSGGPRNPASAAQTDGAAQPPPPDDGWDDLVEVSTRPGLATMIAVHLRIIGAVLSHIAKTVAGQERWSFLWLAIEPMMQVALVVSLYWMFGRRTVYSMPAIPFAIVGVGAWLMFRTMLMRISMGLGREFVLCFYPGVSRLDVFLAKAMFLALTYFSASLGMLAAAHWLEIDALEFKAPYPFLGWWFMLFVFSLSFALTMNYLFLLVPAIRRVMLVIIRGLYLFSSVAAVSEQFPGEEKALFLWNPLVHGLQLLRSAYFWDYKSDDADPTYFLASTLLLFVLGMLCERIQRRRDVTA